MDVEVHALLPLLPHTHGVLDDHLSVCRDSSTMESGLSDPSLTAVEIPLARQEALPQKPLCPLKHLPLREVSVIDRQYRLDVVRMTQQDHALRAQLKVSDIAMSAREADHKADRVAAIIEQMAHERLCGWSRREVIPMSRHGPRIPQSASNLKWTKGDKALRPDQAVHLQYRESALVDP